MKPNTRLILACAALAGLLGSGANGATAADGITRLIGVTQLKAANANDDALKAADKQRALVKQQQQLRDRQRSMESKDRMGNFEIQHLMSQYNQSNKKQSDIQKKNSDTENAIVQNLK